MAFKLSEVDETWVTITDEDAADHPIQLTLCAINGVLNLTQTSSLTIISGKNNSGMMCIEGTIATINNSLKHIVFIPSTNYFGHAGIDIKTSDQGFSGPGGTETDRALLHIYINPEKPCTSAFPIPDSGQTTCYYNYSKISCPQAGEEFYGQDATYSINTQSFTKLDSKGNDLPDSAENWAMVRDNVTGLIWEVKTDDAGIHDKYNTYTWYDSNPNTNGGYNGTSGDMTDTENFITTLNAEKFGGYSDWRIPTVKELASINSLEKFNPAINKNYFPHTMSAFYWSSTSNASDTGYAWGVYFNGVDVYNDAKDSSYYVRAVRGGQCRSFDHLVINSDETVTDVSTGLMWQKTSFDLKMNWQMALSNCESLSFAGYNDWRLPTKEELRSIVDHDNYKPAINRQIFSDTLSAFYWSSMSHALNTGFAWGVYFYHGDDYFHAKNLSYYVRAVRGGQYRSFDHLVIWSPNQGSLWNLNDNIPISWDTKDILGNVTIFMSFQGGKENTYEIIAENTENDGAFDWVATKSSVNCMLKIEPIDDPSKATRNGLFTISGVNITPINHHNTKENTPITINFTVDVSGANTITVEAFSSTDSLLPDDHLSFSASNSNSVTQSVNHSSMDYTLTLTPLPNQWGTSIITISADLSNGFNDSTIFELSVNDPPILSICSYITLTEDQSALLTQNLLTVTDSRSSPQEIQFKIITPPKLGTLARNSIPLSKNDTFTQADINANLLSYTHNGEELATRDEFTFIASDGDLEISETSFFINIELIDDPPIINQIIQNIQTNEDSSEQLVDLSQTFTDSDSPDKYITISILNHSNPSLVTATLTDKLLKLNFQNNQHGEAILTLLANSNDKQITTAFTINVMSIDDLPIVKNPVPDVWVNEDAPATFIDLTPVFFDADGDPISITIQENTNPNLVTPALSEKNLTLEFLPNQHGEACITLLATANGRQISTLFNINVAAIDDPIIIQPVDDIMVDEDAPIQTVDLSQMFMDVDNDLIIDIQSNSNPLLLTASLAQKTMTLQFKENQHGEACITMMASSDTEQKTACIHVTVKPIDDPPVVAHPIADITVNEDAPQQIIDISNVFVDIDTLLSFSIQKNTNTNLLTATLVDKTIYLNFAENQHGQAQITILARGNDKTVTDILGVTVVSINDAPVLKPFNYTLKAIYENVDYSAETQIIDLAKTFTDADQFAKKGIAVFSANGYGAWQYFSDSEWIDFKPIPVNHALLLDADTTIRYEPDHKNGEHAFCQFYAWDRTSGINAQLADITIRGYSTAFSTDSDMLSITVISVNNPPILTPKPSELDTITEDDIDNPGTTIALLLGDSVNDPDKDARGGIAIFACAGTNVWQYSLCSNPGWRSLTNLTSSKQALLLGDDDRIRYLPNTFYEETAFIQFRAWDQTDGHVPGSKIDISLFNETDAFSQDSDTRWIVVTDENDAPVLTVLSQELYTITEDDVFNHGVLLSELINDSTVTDADEKAGIQAIKGLAIYEISGNGDLQYCVRGTSCNGSLKDDWTYIGAVDQTNALILADNKVIRYVPDKKSSEQAFFRFHAWDGPDNDEGKNISAIKTGGTSHFSANKGIVYIQVTDVNDAPVLKDNTYKMAAIFEDPEINPGDTIAEILGINAISDCDGTPVTAIAVTGVNNENGVWQYYIDGKWQNFSDVFMSIAPMAENAILLDGIGVTAQRIRFIPDTNYNGSSWFTCRAWDMSDQRFVSGDSADTRLNGDTTPFSKNEITVTVSVISVDDPPKINEIPSPVVITENCDEQYIKLEGIKTGAYNETVPLIITAFSNNLDLIDSIEVDYHYPDNEGFLTFTPSPHLFGIATISVQVSDTVNVTQRQFTVTVLEVNNPPEFIPGKPQNILEDAKEQIIEKWATNISAGPNEDQALLFHIDLTATNNKSLFKESLTITTDGTITYTPEDDECGQSVFSIVLQDDGGTENGGHNTSEPELLTINVRCVNDPPDFTAQPQDIVVNEDCGRTQILKWITSFTPGKNESDQKDLLAFTIETDADALFEQLPSIAMDGEQNGMLSFKPKSNAYGRAQLEITLNDNSGTENGGKDSSETLTRYIQINPVNDPPTFSMPEKLSIYEDSGQQSINNWAKDMNKGASNESDQILDFTTTVTSIFSEYTTFFVQPPSISLEGVLSFKTEKNVYGSAKISVCLKDNGGIDNGGQNKSNEQTFIIDVTPMDECKAIIVTGTHCSDPVKEAFIQATNQAFSTLNAIGHWDIHYLTLDTSTDCSEGNNTIDELKQAILNGSRDADKLLLYMAGHGKKDYFKMNLTEELRSSQLKQWLDNNQAKEQIIIYDACSSGSFISELVPSDGHKRVIITSSTDDNTVVFEEKHSFSYHFWSSINEGHFLDTAFFTAHNQMIQTQKAKIEADGLTNGNAKLDYLAVDRYCLNQVAGCLSPQYTPCESNYTDNDFFENDNIALSARIFNPYTLNDQCRNFYDQSADWVFIIAPTQNNSYEIRVENPDIYCDPVVEIFNFSYTSLLKHDQGCAGETEIVDWNTTESGIYYVKISNNADISYPKQTAYTLKISTKNAQGSGYIYGNVFGLSSNQDIENLKILAKAVDVESDQKKLLQNQNETKYYMAGIRPGKYQVTAEYPGYLPFTGKVDVRSWDYSAIDIVLSPVGDIDNNHMIDLTDLVICMRIVAGVCEYEEIPISRADIDENNKIGLADIIYMMQWLKE
jgi:hypothetical protein